MRKVEDLPKLEELEDDDEDKEPMTVMVVDASLSFLSSFSFDNFISCTFSDIAMDIDSLV